MPFIKSVYNIMISLAIPTYNRADIVLECFKDVINSDIISEIVITDDYSDINVYQDLQNRVNQLNSNKIKLFRNEKNLKAFWNKYRSVKNCNYEWVILLDSDNILTQKYLNSIIEFNKTTLYLPSNAISVENLNYTEYSNVYIDWKIFTEHMLETNIFIKKYECIFNTGNYFFYRDQYIKNIENENHIYESYACDVLYNVYLWLKNGGNLKIVENMEYYHRLNRTDSWWVNNSANSTNFSNFLKEKIKTEL